MVVAANPQAAQAGLAILHQGGTATDAAIAVQAVLGLVEPQASGLGGGSLILHYDATTHAITSIDGRETAPAADAPTLFQNPDGRPLGFREAVLSGRSVGAPGTIPALALAYKAHGHLPWATLFQPAIALAEHGFTVTPRLAFLIARDAAALAAKPAAHAYLLADGPPLAGATLKNPAYADTLRQIATGGATALQRGPLAAAIVNAVRSDPAPGLMTTDDLAAYTARERPPVCGPYRHLTVCTAGPPSAGGIALIQTLGILAHFNLAALPPDSADAAFLLAESERLAMADRDAYGGDADFIRVPTHGLTDPGYLAGRAQSIDLDHAIPAIRAGNPDWTDTPPPAQPRQPEHGTSDIAIVDAHGNAISMTTTIEGEFGSHLMAGGFFLNNELTDFSFAPTANGRDLANRVQPGKRPRSSMAPAIITDASGRLVAVVGSAGGSRIPAYVAQATIGALDWGLDPARALALPHAGSTGDGAVLESGTAEAVLAPALAARGEKVEVAPLGSGSSMILVTPQGLAGAADPRRDGAALGE